MKKALIYASVPSMIRQFNMNNIFILKELGYKVDVACNFSVTENTSQEYVKSFVEDLKNINVDYYDIDLTRNIFDFSSLIKSYKSTLDLLNENKYDLIHCHTPIAALICRLAGKNSTNYKNCKMIYTAHGFHFFKGNNPIKNFIFRNIEKYAAKYTDVIITINKEDYEAAKKFKLKPGGRVEYVPGVGIDIDKINSIKGNKEELCKELNILNDSILLLSVGELNDNKNHRIVIECLPDLPNNYHYIICGQGLLKDELSKLASKLCVADRLHLLGYRSDVIRIIKSSDIFVFPSKREGLPVSLMEAMACKLPCIASDIRGNRDLLPREGLFSLEKEKTKSAIVSMIVNSKEKITGYDMEQCYEEQIKSKIKRIYSL